MKDNSIWKVAPHQMATGKCKIKQKWDTTSVQSLSHVQLFATPWTTTHQASLSIKTPRACSNSFPLSQWCHPTISSSVILFFSWLHSLALGSLGPLPVLKPAWTSGSSRFMFCWSLAWRILSITLLACECNCTVVCAFFGIASFWDWDENWPFPILWPLLSFPNLLTYWVQCFHNIIF